jgi:hypothetical protein
VKEGIIEKVLVSNSTKRLASGKVQCIRLVNKGDSQKQDQEKEDIVVLPAETDVDEGDAEEIAIDSPGRSSITVGISDKTNTSVEFHLKANIVIHKQILDLLYNAGPRGMTLSVCIITCRL